MVTVKLITNAPIDARPLNDLKEPMTLCDLSEDKMEMAATIRVEKNVLIKELDARQDYFEGAKDTLDDSPFKRSVLLSANFPVSDIEKMIAQNKSDILFLRVYVCLSDDGEENQVLFMAPIDRRKKLIQKQDTYYSEQCCGYPPHTANFAGDPILGLPQ